MKRVFQERELPSDSESRFLYQKIQRFKKVIPMEEEDRLRIDMEKKRKSKTKKKRALQEELLRR